MSPWRGETGVGWLGRRERQTGEVANEVVELVKTVDGINRLHFAREPDLLAAWLSASHVMVAPRTAERGAESLVAGRWSLVAPERFFAALRMHH